MSRTVDRDRGWRRIRKMLRRIDGSEVEVGWFPDARHEEMNTAELAAIHEYGGGKVPARPMIRPVVDKNTNNYRRLRKLLMDRVIAGNMSEEAALETLGARVESDLKEWITDGDHAPNAPSTIARKGSSKPLIDTGLMRSQVSHKVTLK